MKVKIAVCDDSFFDREINKMYIEDYFSGKGYDAEIITYESGNDFLASDYSDCNLVFLDMYMDGISGPETAKEIVKNNKDIKIIFCSSSPEFVDDSVEVSALRYFIKPMSREKFEDVMNELFA